MKQLIAKLDVADPFGNEKVLKVFSNVEEGTVTYHLTGKKSGISFSISNLQCGWRGPSLPDNNYEYNDNQALLNSVVEAVNGGVCKVKDKKLFVN